LLDLKRPTGEIQYIVVCQKMTRSKIDCHQSNISRGSQINRLLAKSYIYKGLKLIAIYVFYISSQLFSFNPYLKRKFSFELHRMDRKDLIQNMINIFDIF